MTAKSTKYPSNPWGPFASDPWSPLLDPVTGPAWDNAVEQARQVRLANQRAAESLKALQAERDAERGADPK